jgi:hypothetical protein
MPIELISMSISAVVGFVFKLIASNQEIKKQQFEMMMSQFTAVETSRENARKLQSPAASFIKRYIVISVVSLFVFVIVAPAIDPTLTTNIISEVQTSGFLGIGAGTKIVVTVISGLLYDDTLRSMLASIIGYYFGSATVRK